MKLYRHHSEKHQRKIEEANEEFVIDSLRKFNFDAKNQAQFFFYCFEKEGAEMYKVDKLADEGVPTELFTYEVPDDIKLLNLANNKEHRALLKKVIENYVTDSYNFLEQVKKEHPKEVNNWIKKGIFFTVTSEDVIDDERIYNGNTYWGQNVLDYERGLILKEEILKLGYDGVIIKDGKYEEVALLKPAKISNDLSQKETLFLEEETSTRKIKIRR